MLTRTMPSLKVLILGFLTLRPFRNHSLRTKLIVTSLIISLVPLSVVSYVSNLTVREALVNAANESLANAADQTATNLNGFIEANLDAVRTEAQLPDFSEFLNVSGRRRADGTGSANDAARMATILRALSRRDQLYILSYALLDDNGIDVADTNTSDVGVDQSRHEYFRGAVTTGLPYVSPVEFSEAADPPSLYFSAPIRDVQGKTTGVLRIRYNASILQQIIANTNGLAGKESYAVLLDENHMRLADGEAPDLSWKTVVPLDPVKVAELQSADRLLRRPADQLSTNLTDFEEGLSNSLAQPFFHAKLHNSDTEPEAVAVTAVSAEPWLIAFGQPKDVFLAPVEAQTRNTLLIGAIMATLVALTAAGGAQLLTGPIVRLTAVAEKVGAGDLGVKADVEDHDEIGKLAKTFNTMTLQLRQTLNGLAERTSELRLANDRLQTELVERQRGEEKIRSALEEKETLLREVHHRVKNNLQAMIALMDMQTSQIHDEETRQFLRELEGQARTMSLVYEQLYQSENLAHVAMAPYLQQLAYHVLETFGGRRRVRLDLDIAPISLDVAEAMPCGLIVNELFTNVLKHAFPPDLQGQPTVHIALQQDGGTYRLTVGDNGAGLPPGYDWRSSRTQGLHLVKLWTTHQLGGTLEVTGDPGTSFTITFGQDKRQSNGHGPHPDC